MSYRGGMRPTRAAAPLLAVLLAFTACSDDGGLDPEAEQDLLEDAILTLDDLPDGFEESEPSDDDSDDVLDECGGEVQEVELEGEIDDVTVAEEGPVAFEVATEDTLGSIEAEIRSVDDDGPVRDVLEALGDDDFLDCVLDTFVEQAEDEGQEIEDLEIESIDAAVDGDASAGVRFSGGVLGFDFVAELHGVLVGDRLVSVEATSLNEGLNDSVIEDALETMIERLEQGS